MRDEIKQICINYLEKNKVPKGCKKVGGSGWFAIMYEQEHDILWQAEGCTGCWNKMEYSIYNYSFKEDNLIEKGILDVGWYHSGDRCTPKTRCWKECLRRER